MRTICVVAMLLMFATARGIAEEPVKAPEKTTILDRAAKAAEVVKVKTEEFSEKVEENAALIIETSENIEKTATAIKEIGWLQEWATGDGTFAKVVRVFLAILGAVIAFVVAVKLIIRKPNQSAP